jgi:hypothetical protein
MALTTGVGMLTRGMRTLGIWIDGTEMCAAVAAMRAARDGVAGGPSPTSANANVGNLSGGTLGVEFFLSFGLGPIHPRPPGVPGGTGDGLRIGFEVDLAGVATNALLARGERGVVARTGDLPRLGDAAGTDAPPRRRTDGICLHNSNNSAFFKCFWGTSMSCWLSKERNSVTVRES